MPYACLAQNLFPHTLEGESAMFKMFVHDPIVLGMKTMFDPKHRYLGDKDTFIDLELLHALHMQIATRLLNAHKKVEKNYSGKNPLPKLVMLFCSETTTKQVSLQTFYQDTELSRK